MANTVLGTHGSGIHASRPAGNAVPDGSLYSCSTHSLIYVSSYGGNSWATWASLTGTGFADPMTTRGDIIVRDSSNTTARLAVGATGKVLKSDGTDASWAYPTFRGVKAYNSSTQSMNGSGTNSGNTLITFNSEEFDTDAFHDTGANTSRITIPTGLTGYYAVGCMIWSTSTVPSTATLIDLLVNGASTVKHGMRVSPWNNTTVSGVWTGSWLVNVSATDYLELQLNNGNASTFNIGHASATVAQNAFWATFVGV